VRQVKRSATTGLTAGEEVLEVSLTSVGAGGTRFLAMVEGFYPKLVVLGGRIELLKCNFEGVALPAESFFMGCL